MKIRLYQQALVLAVFLNIIIPAHSQTIAGGNGHSIALCADSTLNAWGYNLSGQVGNGTNNNSYSAVGVSGLEGVTGIAASYEHSLAIKDDGTIWGWGNNYQNQLGTGDNISSNVPVPAGIGLTNVISISAGWAQSYAVKSDGTVWAWGYNSIGQLGNGTTNSTSIPVQVSNLTDVIAVSAGSYHCLALKNDGTVYGWGTGGSGELGLGNNDGMMLPAQIMALTDVVAISAGSYSHSMALKSDGTLWTWGLNSSGQLGIGTLVNTNLPTLVTSLNNVISIAGANGHSLALTSDGTVWAFGWNLYGQLGNGGNTDSNVPVQVTGLTGIIEIIGGRNHSMARKNDGTVWVWGENGVGQLANYDVVSSNIPLLVENLCVPIIGVDDNENIILPFVFPNPFEDETVLKGTNAGGAITIFDSTGNIVIYQKTSEGQTRLNTGILNSGLYSLNYFDGTKIHGVKLLKL